MTRDEKKRKVFLGGISTNVTEKDLKKYFRSYGPIERATVNREHFTDISRGSGFVIFKMMEDAEALLEENADHILKGKKFNCQRCYSREEIKELKSSTSSKRA